MRVSPLFLVALWGVFMLGTCILATALYRVQVTGVAEFRQRQEKQATRRVSVPGLRGRILDRHGVVLAEARACHDIVCRVERFKNAGSWSDTVAAVTEDVTRLGAVLRRPGDASPKRIARHLRESSAVALTVFRDVDDAALARFAEHAVDFPGFEDVVRPERHYPLGSLAAHVLGYTGRDRPEVLADDTPVHYFENLEIRGRSGVERAYDGYLTGATGEKRVTVDARGFRRHGDVVERESAHGLDLALTLDASLQRVLEDSLEGVVGAGVVLDPNDGAVLAMASAPTYDPNAWRSLCTTWLADPARPLYNRAVSGLYPPGSTFKPITSTAAFMKRDAVGDAFEWTVDTRYDCCGVFDLGPSFYLRCWDRYGHGPIALREAIKQSCNTYFCELGHMLGTNWLFRAADLYGLGRRTGIDLPAEAAGSYAGSPWYAGHTCQTAIGQGMLQVTPLQMAVVAAALANGGRVYRPYLHLRDPGDGAPRPVRTIPCAAADLEVIRQGMRDVVETGTGRRIRTRFGEGRARWHLAVPCAGKTGTAERGRGRKDAWIIAFAPYDQPTVAISLVVENGESGGKTAAPRVQRVLAHVFGETEGRP